MTHAYNASMPYAMEEEPADIIERALGNFPASRLVAEGIILALSAAGLKIVRMGSAELRRAYKRRPGATGGQASGGHARAKAISPERRHEIAILAAEARWGKRE